MLENSRGAAGGAEDAARPGAGKRRFADKQAQAQARARSNFGRKRAARRLDPENHGAPLEALRRVVRGYLEIARRLRGCWPLLFSERDLERGDEESAPGAASAFKTIARHVWAAQQAGELKGGDAERITILILGAIVGAVDMAQYGCVGAASVVSDLESLPLHLIDRLAVKRFNLETAVEVLRWDGTRSF